MTDGWKGILSDKKLTLQTYIIYLNFEFLKIKLTYDFESRVVLGQRLRKNMLNLDMCLRFGVLFVPQAKMEWIIAKL